jgi:DNA-directed RNA polymerase sigma subunit (sigma70/sigma32)
MHLKYNQRNNEIYSLRTDKLMTLTDIGKMYGLTRERIRVIVKKIDEQNENKDIQDIRPTRDGEDHSSTEQG